ncbi:hypothetical protein [Actinoplanes friuliensis]|uniref:hypothetical protein n=1 Tax=Actinoplanes friuliensis TaxID=196914 RepID=UPI00040014F3|nr:hypothetical protein [Actinoplanes friuliensis]
MSEPAAVAVVRHGTRTWVLHDGGHLRFGRSTGVDIPVATQPADLTISRSAGCLDATGRGVLVTNESVRRTMYLQAVPGPEIEVKPGMTVGTAPHERSRIVLLGGHEARYVLDIRSAARGPSTGAARPQAVIAGDPTSPAFARRDLTPVQRRYLAALCEPLLTPVAGVSSATYLQIANRCGVSDRTVRNCLDGLRQSLAADHGVPGLVRQDRPAPGGQGDNFLRALAGWAIDSGNITPDDLSRLDR